MGKLTALLLFVNFHPFNWGGVMMQGWCYYCRVPSFLSEDFLRWTLWQGYCQVDAAFRLFLCIQRNYSTKIVLFYLFFSIWYGCAAAQWGRLVTWKPNLLVIKCVIEKPSMKMPPISFGCKAVALARYVCWVQSRTRLYSPVAPSCWDHSESSPGSVWTE